MSKVTFILGGIKSGKSNYAQSLVKCDKVTYIATARAIDKEMKQKIDDHQKNRPPSWKTYELNGNSIDECLKNINSETIIIDCLGNFIANNIRHCEAISKFGEAILKNKTKFKQIIIVSNEVGLSIVSQHVSGRKFCNTLGLLNQEIAAIADEVYLVVAGIPIALKS